MSEFDLDGTETLHVERPNAEQGRDRTIPTTTAAIAALAAGASLGGTDGDGNVYSIEYDPDGLGLGIDVDGIDGSITYITALPSAAAINITAADGSNILASFNSNGFEIDAIGPGGSPTSRITGDNAGEFFMSVFDGVSIDHSIALTLADGIQLDGVTVDPTAPWPGG